MLKWKLEGGTEYKIPPGLLVGMWIGGLVFTFMFRKVLL